MMAPQVRDAHIHSLTSRSSRDTHLTSRVKKSFLRFSVHNATSTRASAAALAMTALSTAVAFNSKAAFKLPSPYKGGLDVIAAQRPSSHD